MKICCLIFLQIFLVIMLHAQAVIPDSLRRTIKVNDSAFTKVEIESEFPGGQAAWIKFLTSHLTYSEKAVRKNIQGTVVVQFIVDKNGMLSDIQAISGPAQLQNAAVDIIKQSPKWIPAVQFGRKVKSYKKQPIVFRLQ